ncbi:unnamed protein product [Clonostachys rosea]|uniref:Sulfatase N-terminal domain-containing protein n=1 Tax=Bionectria ochroleuca TaxID=29856 RepID=A0ABY6UE39_BIOOC|nr:unnamed protein product [Clonostachys rosea]
MAQSKRPNFLVIVADDLGFSDLGCYGSEIKTPNVDKLAQSGVRFTDFHAAAACSPTRAMILTGTDHHIAGLGNLIELTNGSSKNAFQGIKLDTAPQRGMPGYEGYLNERVVTMSEILRDEGYHTLLSGKWHLGLTPQRAPFTRGFERSFAHLPACSNHFAFEPAMPEDEEAPAFMAAGYIALHMENDKFVKKLPADWYSSDGYGDILKGYLQDWHEKKEENRPFFAYLPFTAPHWPLQAPQEYIKNYKGVYDDGPDALRLRRLERLKEIGMVRPDVEPAPVEADEVSEWSDLSPEEQAMSSKSMEVYAGMVECIDANVGKVVDYLTEIGELDNTFVCFMSDNGAEGAAYEAYPVFQGGPMAHLQRYYDNSFIWYGPRWAQAATAPGKLYKGFTSEGGVRVPMVTRFPSHLQQSSLANTISHKFSTMMDLAPTILEMAGAKHPGTQYKGREVVTMRGKSMLPYITGAADSIHGQDFIQGWEMCGRAAVRYGDWKIIYIPKPRGPEPLEIHDVGEQHPDILNKMIKMWDQYVLETGVIPLSPDLGEYIAATEAQMPEGGWMEYYFWKKGAREDPERFMNEPPRFQRTLKQF